MISVFMVPATASSASPEIGRIWKRDQGVRTQNGERFSILGMILNTPAEYRKRDDSPDHAERIECPHKTNFENRWNARANEA